MEKLASDALENEKESGSQFMTPEPPKSKRGRPPGSGKDKPRPEAQGAPSMEAQVHGYLPLSTGVVETLSGFCQRIAEDQRAAIIEPRRGMMIQSGALCGYYFIGPDQEKWVALGTFLLMGAMAFTEAWVLRQENLYKFKQQKAAQDAAKANGAAGAPTPVQ